MLNAKTSIAILAAIGLLILAGNLVLDKGASADGSDPAVAAQPVRPPDPDVAMFNVDDDFQAARDRWQAVQAMRASAALARKREQQKIKSRLARLGVDQETLDAIGSCESGGDPKVVSSDGSYHGKYQFSVDTWQSVGGKGLPEDASETEQDYRAAMLYARSGPGQWPVCGY